MKTKKIQINIEQWPMTGLETMKKTLNLNWKALAWMTNLEVESVQWIVIDNLFC